ncbi:MAG: MtrB/PioB family outer membrane beta-barrel protein, partial [Alphaproteobacteria bacterium]|nr:MtrB/PioB family outer membrane beta-barrel protein [Alphaproteobacteria bacterium]
YNFSNFIDNNNGGFAFQGWTVRNVGGTNYLRSGVYALPPSNQAHNFTGEIGYNMTPATRFDGTFVYGLQLQNDPFVAATQNSYVTGDPTMSAQLASNPGSLNGLVQTFFGKAGVSSRPISKLDLHADYTTDVRAPATSSMWIYGNPTDNTSLKYREAVPEGWMKQSVELKAGYHVTPSTRVTLGYAFRDNQRSNAITHETQENEGSVKVHTMFTDNLLGSIGYTYNDRTASTPDFSLWNYQINSDCGSSVSGTLGCQQVPFYEAARTENAVSLNLMDNITHATSANLFVKFADDQYHTDNAVYSGVTNPSVGLNHDYNLQIAPSVNYRLSDSIETHVFYSFMRDYRSMRALNNATNPTTPGVGYYSETSVYDIHTAGVGGDWKATDKWKFGADYTVSYGDQRFSQNGSWDTTEAGQTYGGDPSLSAGSMDHVLRLHASYDYTKAMQFYAGYEFDSLDMSDWALTGASVGQILTGDVPARYNVSTILTGLKLKF